VRLFGRRWRVTIDTLEITDLDIAFKVTRSLYSRAGTLELDVFNLSDDHRAQARRWRAREGTPPNQVTRRTRVRLEAGHAEGTSVIFQGNVRRVDTIRENPDWITRVTAGDGEESLRSARGARSFGPDTSIRDVIRYCAEASGVGLGNLDDALAGAQFDRVGSILPGGAVVHGRVERQLHHLLRSVGLEWSIQDGVLQVLPRGGALARTAVLLSTDTGLIGSPEVGLNRVVTAKAIIQPDLTPGAQVQLKSAVVAGYYRVETAEYAGETRGEPWDVTMTMRRIRDDGTIEGVTPP
jgi:hypothetical protein